MSPHSQTNSGMPSTVISPAPPIVIFELNQARRKKVTREVEAVRSAYLEWPTLEGLEAFVEKRVEYGEMMEDHVADLEAVVQEQLVIVGGLKRAANLAEERRLQELQRALARMDPAEAEAAQRAEQELALRRQRLQEAKLAELRAEFARIKARVRAESQHDNANVLM